MVWLLLGVALAGPTAILVTADPTTGALTSRTLTDQELAAVERAAPGPATGLPAMPELASAALDGGSFLDLLLNPKRYRERMEAKAKVMATERAGALAGQLAGAAISRVSADLKMGCEEATPEDLSETTDNAPPEPKVGDWTSTTAFFGHLEVAGPPGAKVWVDGLERGSAPLQLQLIEAGSHVVRLEFNGLQVAVLKVRVVGGAKTLVDVALQR